MDILDKARAGQNALEKIVSSIPGFKGYKERELRREADRIQREYLSARLDECKKALNDQAAQATRSGSLDSINDVESARKKLDKAANRIRYADRGYAGFFDAIKVDEAALARVYEFDLALLRDVDAVRGEATAAGMIGRLDALDARLAEREQILGGIR